VTVQTYEIIPWNRCTLARI